MRFTWGQRAARANFTNLTAQLVSKQCGCVNNLSVWHTSKPKCKLPVKMASIGNYLCSARPLEKYTARNIKTKPSARFRATYFFPKAGFDQTFFSDLPSVIPLVHPAFSLVRISVKVEMLLSTELANRTTWRESWMVLRGFIFRKCCTYM